MIQRLEEESASTHLAWDDHTRWDFVLSADACGWAVDANPFFFTSCIHGFGHGAHMMHRLNLTAGLDVCRAVEQRDRPLPPLQPWHTAVLALNTSSVSEHAQLSTSGATKSAAVKSIFEGLETEMSGQCATGVFMELGDLTSKGWYGSEADAAMRVPPADSKALANYLANTEERDGYRRSDKSNIDSSSSNGNTLRREMDRSLLGIAHSSATQSTTLASSSNSTHSAELPFGQRHLGLIDRFSGSVSAMFGGSSRGSKNRKHTATIAASLKNKKQQLSGQGRPSIGGRNAPLALRVATGLGRGLTPELCASTANGSGGGRAVARACWFRRFTSSLGRRYVFEVFLYFFVAFSKCARAHPVSIFAGWCMG